MLSYDNAQNESLAAATRLSDLGVDLLEISGGTYESPAMTGTVKKQSTHEREAYFLDYCEKIAAEVSCPLMLTGGFRTTKGMEAALESGACQVVGLGRSLVIDPELPKIVLARTNYTSPLRPVSTGLSSFDRLIPLEITWYTHQIHRISKGKNPKPQASAWYSMAKTLAEFGCHGLSRVR